MQWLIVGWIGVARGPGDGFEQAEQLNQIGVHGFKLRLRQILPFTQQLQPVFLARGFQQSQLHFVKEAVARFSFLRGFDVSADLRAREEQLFAQHVFAFFFAQVFIEPHRAQGVLGGLGQNGIVFRQGLPPG